MGTIKALCLEAERQARQSGEQEPGAEHFLLAAIELPDGSARQVFARLGVDADAVRGAVAAQYDNALRNVGVDPRVLNSTIGDSTVTMRTATLYRAKPSGASVMQALAALRRSDSDGPLLGAHVLIAVAGMNEGVAIRTLRALGIEPSELAGSAKVEADKAPSYPLT